MNNKLYRINLTPAPCGLDLGDGSERAEYVCQDYILHKLGRPHRSVNIMYTYYPKDEQWPERISVACKDMVVTYQWDYPYDDYPIYGADGHPFDQMRDIRMHGQDVILTLTIDCSLEDCYLREIARKLKPFGRMKFRINHECYGTWFTHNTRYTHKEVGEFYVRFARIVREEAPNVRLIFCAGFIDKEGKKVTHEDEFIEAYRIADIWSADGYLALNSGWPYTMAEVGSGRYASYGVEYYYNRFKKTSERIREITGQDKVLISAEFNTDGDVTGTKDQGESVLRFANMIKENEARWFGGFSMYQFRDRGRLGLEQEDPNNNTVGIEQPLMETYKEIIKDPYFNPVIADGEELAFPATLRWGDSEDAEGVAIDYVLEDDPKFFEITFEDNLSLMIEFCGKWFYKAPHVKTIDLMPALWHKTWAAGDKLSIRIFATPPEGINPETEREDWNYNYYAQLTKAPDFRVRYEAPGRVE